MLRWLRSWNGKVPPCHLPDDGLCYHRDTSKRKAAHGLDELLTQSGYRLAVNGVTFTFKRKAPWSDRHLTWYYYVEDEAGGSDSWLEWMSPLCMKPVECYYQINHLRPQEFPPQREWASLRLRQAPRVFNVQIFDGDARQLVAAGSVLPFLLPEPW